jgi:hypothetical protein
LTNLAPSHTGFAHGSDVMGLDSRHMSEILLHLTLGSSMALPRLFVSLDIAPCFCLFHG